MVCQKYDNAIIFTREDLGQYFLKKNSVKPLSSTPLYHLASNGLAEWAVQTYIVQRMEEEAPSCHASYSGTVLLHRAAWLSPAKLMFGRCL